MLVALGPAVVLLVLLVLRLRRMWSVDCRAGLWDLPSPGGGTAGVREPRRPLVPAGTAGAALEPDVEETAAEVPWPAVQVERRADAPRRLRAS